jgi:hypothetical protein
MGRLLRARYAARTANFVLVVSEPYTVRRATARPRDRSGDLGPRE